MSENYPAAPPSGDYPSPDDGTPFETPPEEETSSSMTDEEKRVAAETPAPPVSEYVDRDKAEIEARDAEAAAEEADDAEDTEARTSEDHVREDLERIEGRTEETSETVTLEPPEEGNATV